jgi:prepilin-type processing-associated H-X9-DG protein
MKFGFAVLAAAVAIAAMPLAAHHSFAAEYDSAKPIEVTGTVTKVEWTNPHARLYVDVKDPDGHVTNWNFELGGPLQLNRLGWKRDAVKVGDQISVQGYLAKDGSKMANARNVVFADGHKIFSGSSGDGGPGQ